MPEIAYVNGEFLPLERAMVSVEDRGFQFADAVYEVVRTYHGQPFAVPEHLDRLFHSLDGIQLRHAFTVDQLQALIHEAVQRAGFPESTVYLQVTRGPAPRHRGVPAQAAPTLVLTVRELHPPLRAREYGLACLTVPDNRWARCDIKSVALLANVLAYQTAKTAGADDAIFVEADAAVSEATAGNVFVFVEDELRTPPKGPRLLSGVTRAKILEAARAAGLSAVERRVDRADLYRAQEVFLTSTTNEVAPVVVIDGRTIGSGRPGPIAGRVYQQFVALFARA